MVALTSDPWFILSDWPFCSSTSVHFYPQFNINFQRIDFKLRYELSLVGGVSVKSVSWLSIGRVRHTLREKYFPRATLQCRDAGSVLIQVNYF